MSPLSSARRDTGAVVIFLGASFGVTWAIWLPLLVQTQTSGLDMMPWTFFLASIGPCCGAIAASLWQEGPRGLMHWARRTFSLRFRPVWWLAAIGMPIAYFLIAWIVPSIATGHWPDPAGFGTTEKLPGLGWPLVTLVWVFTFGLGEESGWRGWLLPTLSRRMSAFWAALIVAGIWIVWHAPAFFFNPTYTEMGAGVIGWMLALVAGSYLLAWMTVGARWSIVPVLIWHAGFDLLTAADQSAGVIASTVSGIVMTQGALCGWLLWRRRKSPSARSG